MEFETVATCLQFPEGPVPMPDGSVLLVEIARGTLTRVTAAGQVDVIAELGGGPNGAAIGPDGFIYVCNNGGMTFHRHDDGSLVPAGVPQDYLGGSIQRVDPGSGGWTTLYRDCDGVSLNGPNDIVFDATGGFWFTDMGKSRATGLDHGALYYARSDGSGIARAPVTLWTPNGIGLSPDGTILWVAETITSRLWGFDLVEPGKIGGTTDMLTPGRVLGPLPGYQLLDSLAVEADGNICVATPVTGAISIYSPNGQIDQIEVPDRIPTNIAFGGVDQRSAWITAGASGRLLRCTWPRSGLMLAHS